jgi:hypothetical protein
MRRLKNLWSSVTSGHGRQDGIIRTSLRIWRSLHAMSLKECLGCGQMARRGDGFFCETRCRRSFEKGYETGLKVLGDMTRRKRG